MSARGRGAILHPYALGTAGDTGEDYAAAVRYMRDEPGEVALGTGLAEQDVVEWCEMMMRCCTVHDADDAVPGRICGGPLPCPEHS